MKNQLKWLNGKRKNRENCFGTNGNQARKNYVKIFRKAKNWMPLTRDGLSVDNNLFFSNRVFLRLSKDIQRKKFCGRKSRNIFLFCFNTESPKTSKIHTVDEEAQKNEKWNFEWDEKNWYDNDELIISQKNTVIKTPKFAIVFVWFYFWKSCKNMEKKIFILAFTICVV